MGVSALSGPAGLHRTIPKGLDLKGVLCIQTERALRKDFTVARNWNLYQIWDNLRVQRVTVEEHLDGSLWITHQPAFHGPSLRLSAHGRNASYPKGENRRSLLQPKTGHF